MIPSNEEIKNLEHGDIIYVLFDLDENNFSLKNKSSISNSITIELYYIGVDRNNWILASIKSMPKYEEKMFSCFEFSDSNFGDDFHFVNEHLKQINKSDLVNFDTKKCLYIDDCWVTKIKKRQKYNLDPGGMNCIQCNEFYTYAAPNLSNGKMACWTCRDSYKWKYSELYVGAK